MSRRTLRKFWGEQPCDSKQTTTLPPFYAKDLAKTLFLNPLFHFGKFLNTAIFLRHPISLRAATVPRFAFPTNWSAPVYPSTPNKPLPQYTFILIGWIDLGGLDTPLRKGISTPNSGGSSFARFKSRAAPTIAFLPTSEYNNKYLKARPNPYGGIRLQSTEQGS
jgi:hypothetical protein